MAVFFGLLTLCLVWFLVFITVALNQAVGIILFLAVVWGRVSYARGGCSLPAAPVGDIAIFNPINVMLMQVLVRGAATRTSAVIKIPVSVVLLQMMLALRLHHLGLVFPFSCLPYGPVFDLLFASRCTFIGGGDLNINWITSTSVFYIGFVLATVVEGVP